MLTDTQAKEALDAEMPGIEIAAQTRYRDVWLFRVVFPSEAEANYDPFFSVHIDTGEVSEFSVLTDGDPSEIAVAFNVSIQPGEEVTHDSS